LATPHDEVRACPAPRTGTQDGVSLPTMWFGPRWWEMRFAAWTLVSTIAACAPPNAYPCAEDGQCVRRDAPDGICAAPGYCAFPSDGCPSGYRFGAHAGDGLADACVPVSDTETGTSTVATSLGTDSSTSENTGSSTSTTDGSNTTDTTTDPTESDASETSTGGPSDACEPLWEDDLLVQGNWAPSSEPEVGLEFGAQGLVITPDASTPGYAGVLWQDSIPTEFEVTVEVPEILSLQTDVTETIVVVEDQSRDHRLGFQVAEGSINAFVRIAGAGMLHAGPEYDLTQHRFMRIRNVAGQVSFLVSGDGDIYTDLLTTDGLVQVPDPLYLILTAGLWDVSEVPVGQARFTWAHACTP
jgi:hypothetical protein